MRDNRIHTRSLRRVTALVAVLALVAVACDPGKVTPVAGNGASGNTGDGGPAASATFETPSGVVAIPGGGYDVADATACVIRHVDPSGTITTIAGNGTCGNSGDGGPATAAEINPAILQDANFNDLGQSGQLALGPNDSLYLSDSGNNAVRRIDSSGTITTEADNLCPQISKYVYAVQDLPRDLVVTSTGAIYVECSDSVLRLDGPGTTTTVYSGPTFGIGLGVGDTVLVSANSAGDDVVGTLQPDGSISALVDVTSATGDPTVQISHLAVDAAGHVYGASGPHGFPFCLSNACAWQVVDGTAVYRLSAGQATRIAGNGSDDPASGAQTGYGPELALNPRGLALTDRGDLLLTSGHVVYRLDEPADATPHSGTGCSSSDYAPGADLHGLDLHGVDLYGCDLSNADLSGTNLTDATLTGATFADANLTGADLNGAEASQTTFTGATLDGTDFTATTLAGVHGCGIAGTPVNLPSNWVFGASCLVGPGADLTGADLTGANLDGADLAGTDFSSTVLADVHACDLTGTPVNLPTDWEIASGCLVGPGADLSGANLTGADLTGANLTGANLTGADLTSATLEITDLAHADLAGANFTGASLGGATVTDSTVTGTDFTGADFSYLRTGAVTGTPTALPADWALRSSFLVGPTASLTGFDLGGVDLSDLDLHAADLSNSGLAGDDLTGTDLTNAKLSRAVLTGANLTGTDLTGVDLTGVTSGSITGIPTALPANWQLTGGYLIGPGAELFGANLTGLDLTGADLASADLWLADLSYANLTNANLSNASLLQVTANHATVTSANFTGANFDRLRAGAVVGTPASLPTSWALRGTFLLGPSAYATGFNMTGVDLSNLDLTGASLAHSNLSTTDLTGTTLATTTLTSTKFTGAIGTPSGGSSATYANTTCPDATVATSPATCVGHGFGF